MRIITDPCETLRSDFSDHHDRPLTGDDPYSRLVASLDRPLDAAFQRLASSLQAAAQPGLVDEMLRILRLSDEGFVVLPTPGFESWVVRNAGQPVLPQPLLLLTACNVVAQARGLSVVPYSTAIEADPRYAALLSLYQRWGTFDTPVPTYGDSAHLIVHVRETRPFPHSTEFFAWLIGLQTMRRRGLQLVYPENAAKLTDLDALTLALSQGLALPPPAN